MLIFNLNSRENYGAILFLCRNEQTYISDGTANDMLIITFALANERRACDSRALFSPSIVRVG